LITQWQPEIIIYIMSYEPLHHKYRPQTFAELVGQETISLTLTNAIALQKIAPAYLFTGPRGTGKTSSARILAKSLNCLYKDRPTPHPCGKCEVCQAIAMGSALDVVEVDAASNTGVDNIREIIERSRYAPVQCRYKVYAIDECHMLSTAAFNALLKTLEEPPPQVVFVLATTDPQRVLSTIISRCQRFDYRRIPLEKMVEHLEYIAKQEQISINDEALTLIAQIANGGLRDAESLLDQLSLLPETITVEKVWDLVGAVPERDLLALLNAIKCDRHALVIQQCRNLLDRGREPLVVLQNLASFYLNLLIAKTAPQSSDLVAVTETCWQQLCTEATDWDLGEILRGQQHLKDAEIQIKQTTQPRLWLEVTLLGLLSQGARNEERESRGRGVQGGEETSPHSPSARLAPKNEERGTRSKEQGARNEEVEVQGLRPKTTNEESNSSSTINHQPSTINHQQYEGIWQKVIDRLQPPTTKALLSQQCHLVSFNGNSAIVGISSAKLQRLHQGKVVNIEAAFERVCQRKIKVSLEVASQVNSTEQPIIASSVSISESATTIVESQTVESISELPTSITPSPAKITHSDRPKSEPIRVSEPSELEIIDKVKPDVFQSPHSSSVANPKPTAIIEIIHPEATSTESEIEREIEDDGDLDILQQAIADLTQSFAGELVELDSIDLPQSKVVPEDRESVTAIESDGKNLLSNRPDLSEYDDEEDIPF
jgi:DNA polymerase III subunit gamma/tau